MQKMQETVSIPGLGRYPGVGDGNPFQYSCLENSLDRGAWWATVHGLIESFTRLSTAEPSRLLIWWVWYHLAHNEQLQPRGHLIIHVLRIIPNKFIQSHLCVIFLASAIFTFLVLHYVCDGPSKYTNSWTTLLPWFNSPFKMCWKRPWLVFLALIQKWFTIKFVLLFFF